MSVRPPRSIHQQIADELRARIVAGEFPPGALLPAEGVLASVYGVSRVTINRAMSELRRERLVEVRRGVGTFVTANDVVDYGIEWPRDVWAAVSAAADRDDVTIDAWVIRACREYLGGS